MNIIMKNYDELDDEVSIDLYQTRYEVFCERLKWDIPNIKDKLEKDDYDHNDTKYFLSYNENKISGGCRIIPTTSKFMISDLWGEDINVEQYIQPNVWELSRMFVHPEYSKNTTLEFGLIMKNAVSYAIKNGIDKYLIITTLALERVLNRNGVTFNRIGTPITLQDTSKAVGGFVLMNQETLNGIQQMIDKQLN